MFSANEIKIFRQAAATRDHRFDGRFFIGVKTTGIYCRPVCPAKPLPKNMIFFSSAHQAEQTGYRPCMRCRPEVAPFSPAWIGTSAVVRRALNHISDGRLNDLSEEDFASSFGMTARHLRRLFVKELGATPKQISDNQRLNFARSLLLETNLPVIEVALSSGFHSVRRFNDAMKKRFSKNPSQVRKNSKNKPEDPGGVCLQLSYRPPFDWTTLLNFCEKHLVFGSEQIVGRAYIRHFIDPFSQKIARLKVEDQPHLNSLRVSFVNTSTKSLFGLCRELRSMFDLDADPMMLESCFQQQKRLVELIRHYPGIRIPRGWDPFEMALATILGQLVSVQQAQRLLQQLIEAYGDKVTDPTTGETVTLFPDPEKLLRTDLSAVKTTQRRRDTIHSLCRLLAADSSWFSRGSDLQEIRQRLLRIKGIGPWSVEYICLRAFGDSDAFPSKDLIIGRTLATFPDIDPNSLRPWRAYLTLYLWKSYVAEKTKQLGLAKDIHDAN